MTYKLIEYTPELDLSEFYGEAEKRGFENNHSQKSMFDCFRNEREWKGWMLEYNGRYVGGVCAHSFDDVMGPNTYRILARTCVFTDFTHRPSFYTKSTSIIGQQCAAAQFYVPIALQHFGVDNKFYATSNANPVGNQQRVNRLWFPVQEKLERFKLVKTQFYRGCNQNIWELNVANWCSSIATYDQWPCEFPNGDPRISYVKL
jgi:hypothetical protein